MTRRRLQRLWPPQPLSCELARESVSVRMDGERPAAPRRALAAHLATCRDCRAFEAGASTLAERRLSVRAPRPVPTDLAASLALLLPTGSTVAAVRPPTQRRRAIRWRRASQWAAAVTMAVAAVVAFPLAASSHPRMVPSRQPTPCTASLDSRGARAG
jgi:RNA polymerase sigma-70 factor (ECF subfamily)